MMIEYIKSDLCRYVGEENVTFRSFLKTYFLHTGFKYSVWLRATRSSNIVLAFVARVQRRRFSTKYMLDIPSATDIGFGLYLGHGKCIVISPSAKLGNNVNLSQFTTIGSNHGQAASVADNVYIGPNVCLVENVKIGTNAKIGAGAVVTKDIPENATAAGVPARILKFCEKPNSYVHNRYPLK